jgi:hypothetical protein
MIIHIKETPKDLLKEGKHDVTISQIWEGTAPSGSDYFEPQFQNEFGYVRGRFYNTEKSMPRIIELFKVCDLKTEPNSSIDTNSLIGKRLSIIVEKKEREGRLFLDVVRFEKSMISNEEVGDNLIENEDDLPF